MARIQRVKCVIDRTPYQHHSQVNGHYGFKEEWFEVVGCVGYKDEKDGGDVNCQDGSQKAPPQDNLHIDSPGPGLVDACLPYEVLGQVLGSQILQPLCYEIYKLSTIPIWLKNHGTGLKHAEKLFKFI